MKTKFQDDAEESESNGTASNGNEIHWTQEDKEKGNLKKFEISKKTIKKLKARNVEFLFPVQSESFAPIYEQSDCLVQATKGSGKTLAYALPIVELLHGDKSFELTAGRAPRVVVVAPTRDNAKQISDDFQSIVNDLVVVPIFGGKKKSDDQETAVADGCDILVATPDRLKEFLDNEKVDLSTVQHLVLDEVDQMLEEPVVDDIKKVLKQVFTSDRETKAQLIVFTATSPDALRKVTKKCLSADAVTINVSKKSSRAKSGDDEGFDETVNGSSGNVSTKTDDGSRSLLTKQENYTTYQLSTNEEIKGIGFVFKILRNCLGEDFDAKSAVSQIAFTKDYLSAVFDMPSEYDEQIRSNWQNAGRTKLSPVTELPELDESSMTDNKSFSRGGSGGGGGGNRNGGSSNGCFKCGKEGHKSFECPDAGGYQRNGGNRGGAGGGGGGGGCFNCGKDGHKSFECPEPKKAGGGGRSFGGGAGGAGGQRSNACFNCGKEGHRSAECSEPRKGGGSAGGCFNCGKDGHKSFECPEPKKAGGGRSGGGGGGGGGGGNACFNCGQEGHRSFDCPEPKKSRPSSGFGGRGGGFGGGRGGARGGGPKRTFGGYGDNSYAAGETNSKKIKFDDDDE